LKKRCKHRPSPAGTDRQWIPHLAALPARTREPAAAGRVDLRCAGRLYSTGHAAGETAVSASIEDRLGQAGSVRRQAARGRTLTADPPSSKAGTCHPKRRWQANSMAMNRVRRRCH